MTMPYNEMIQHWLSTPPNGYFAQSYGCNIKEQLLKNPSSVMADGFIAKLRQDIPLLNRVQVDIFSDDFDRLFLVVGRQTIKIE